MASDPYLLSEVLAIANIHPFYVPKIKYPPDEETVKAVQEQVKRDAKKVNLSSQSLLQKHNLPQNTYRRSCYTSRTGGGSGGTPLFFATNVHENRQHRAHFGSFLRATGIVKETDWILTTHFVGHLYRSMDLIAEICENGGASVLCGETFMYGFIVPILGFMIKDRLHIDPSQTQKLTSNVLAFHGAISVISGPVIGHFADKVESQRTSLLISMLGCIIGTLMVASAHYVTVLFTGRFLQSIAESTVWIVGLTTVTGIVPENQLGTVMGVMMSFINTGMLTGPIASGFLLERAGYWEMWSVPLVVLTLNIIACLIMVEPTSKQSCEPEAMGEAECLLANRVDPQSSPSPPNFWKLMLCDSRVLTVWLVGIASTTVSTSFHATLPLHVQEVFGWGPSMTGLLFSCFSLPTLFVGPLAGWVRDTIGAKLPATASLAVQAGLLGLAGVAGNDQFSWARRQGAGPALYIVSLLAIGALRPFMSAIGPAELSTIVKEYQARTPGNFGPQGGLSRVFSMVDVSASFGMMIGPIIGGVLKETIGYTYMSCAFGLLYFILAILVFNYLGSKHRAQELPEEAQAEAGINSTGSSKV